MQDVLHVLFVLGLRLGTMAFDDCFSEKVALDQALQLVKLQSYTLESNSLYQCADNSQPK